MFMDFEAKALAQRVKAYKANPAKIPN